MAYLRVTYISQEFSLQASDLMLASWRDKTNAKYGSSFVKWACCCPQQNRDPLSGVQTWGKHFAQMLEALLQALEKCLSTSTSTNAPIK